MDWSCIIDAICNYKKFVITSHVNLEGDAVGSALALASFLRKLGKETVIINHDDIPQYLRFLLNDEKILRADNNQAEYAMYNCEAVFVVDVSNWDHLGNTATLIQNAGKPVYCIDHHRSDQPIGDYTVINTQASSTGILIYDLIKSYSRDMIDGVIAQNIYTSILTDTGNFKYSNTNAQAYKVAGELLEQGIDHSYICQCIYEHNSWSRFRLMHKALGTLTKEAGGKIAWIKITRDMIAVAKATQEDSEGFVDMLRTIDGVEISILFREIEDDKVRATFRSKQMVDVQRLASFFSGGGHCRAAGATIFCPLDEAISKVLNQAKKALTYAVSEIGGN